MKKSITIAALAGALSFAAVPVFAQSAAGPEPMQGAQPMDNGGGSMDKGMSKGSMSKGSMMKKKSSKHMMKKHKSM